MKYLYLCLMLSLLYCSCHNADYTPKPRGFYKIDFPDKSYIRTQTGCPFDMEIPTYSSLLEDHSSAAQKCWKNIDFPQFNARLHLSYHPISPGVPLEVLTEDARTFAFKHTSKATAIIQNRIVNDAHKIYGIEYEIRGNTASNYQFYISDSTKHYLRGALYFNEKPHLDSIQPVLDFVKEDIEHMISSLRWK